MWLLCVRFFGGVEDASTDRTTPECLEGESKMKVKFEETVTRRASRLSTHHGVAVAETVGLVGQ